MVRLDSRAIALGVGLLAVVVSAGCASSTAPGGDAWPASPALYRDPEGGYVPRASPHDFGSGGP